MVHGDTVQSTDDRAMLLRGLLGGSLEVRGEPIETEKRPISREQIGLWAVLGIACAGGFAASFIADHFLPLGFWRSIVREIGLAFFIAAFLGLTIDTFLKVRIARDVFEAAFRYVLPQELRDEAARIIGYKFMCTRHHMRVVVRKVDDEHVMVGIKIERTIENISRHSEMIQPLFAVDRWGFANLDSKIESYALKIDGKEVDLGGVTTSSIEKLEIRPERMELKPGQRVTFVSVGEEPHRHNDNLYFGFTIPAVNPRVYVEVPPDTACSCTFGTPGERITESDIAKEYILDGTQFPGQQIRVRWYPKPPAA